MNGPAGDGATVVVSTYEERRWDELAACLDSVANQTRPPLETIVVADHNQRLLERVQAAFPAVRAVPNGRSRGLAGARNTGVELARGALVAFIDDDAQAEPQWLERLAEALADEGAAGAGGALVPLWPGRPPRWLPAEFLWTVGCSYTGLPAGPGPIRNPIGANMAVRTRVLREVGGFREGDGAEAPRELRSRGVVRAAGNIPDDTDLAIRVSQLHPGALWLYQPAAVVHHAVSPERATVGYFLRRCYEEGVGKAGLSRRVGGRDGLRAERRQLALVLPRGVWRGLRDLLGGDLGGGMRAAAICLGTAAAATGFVTAILSFGWGRR